MVSRGTYRDEQDVGTLNLWILKKLKALPTCLVSIKRPSQPVLNSVRPREQRRVLEIARVPSVRAVLHG